MDILVDVLEIELGPSGIVLTGTEGTTAASNCPALGSNISQDCITIELVETVYVGGGGDGAFTGNLHEEVEFSFIDNFPLIIGIGVHDLKIVDVRLEITQPFDNGVLMTVGTEAAQALLMPADENVPGVTGVYYSEVNQSMNVLDVFKLFLIQPGEPATIGSGKVTILFN